MRLSHQLGHSHLASKMVIIQLFCLVCAGWMVSMWCLGALSMEWMWWKRSRALARTAERPPRRSSLLTVDSCNDERVSPCTGLLLIWTKKGNYILWLVSFVWIMRSFVGTYIDRTVCIYQWSKPQEGLLVGIHDHAVSWIGEWLMIVNVMLWSELQSSENSLFCVDIEGLKFPY